MVKADKENILFGKFAIIECLKKDEFTSVYRARHLYLDKDIILKLLNTNLITDQEIISRFKREARILARLDHPNIIKVLDFGEFEKVFYISFMYFKSRSLREIIRQEELPTAVKIKLLAQLLYGLAAAHDAGIIHRDLKPDNILVDKEMQLKIADFGLAVAEEDSMVTQKSSIVGTPGYMSPEQIRGERLTPKSDLYTVGIITFELFNKKNPFLGFDLNSTLNNILVFKYEQLEHTIQNYPPGIEEILRNTLQNNPHQRIDSATLLIDFIADTDTGKQKKSLKKHYRIAGLFVLLVVFSILLILYSLQSPLQQSTMEPEQQMQTDSVESSLAEISIPYTKDVQSTPGKPEEKNIIAKTIIEEVPAPGNLFLSIVPDAYVVVDSGEARYVTSDTIYELSGGQHVLRLTHPEYPAHLFPFEILPGKITKYRVALDTLCAYFYCTVYPWGDVYIDRLHVAQTPFFEPIRLTPGRYLLQIKNPDFPDYADSLIFFRADTLDFQIDLEELSRKKNPG